MKQIGQWIDRVLRGGGGDASVHEAVAGEVVELCRAFPLPH